MTHDPRETSLYNKTYTVAYLNNMDNCRPVTYLNMPIDELKKYAKLSIQDDKVSIIESFCSLLSKSTHSRLAGVVGAYTSIGL